MKNAILLHGAKGTPQDFWFPWIHHELERRDYHVWAPQLPDSEEPNLNTQLPYILENGTFTSDTLLIAHSAGCPLALAILEKLPIKIEQALLVAAFIESPHPNRLLKESYEWEKIKSHVQDFIVINSENDPWGCNDIQGKKITDKVGGTLIIRYGEGHMGSNVYKQPYPVFHFLLKLINS